MTRLSRQRLIERYDPLLTEKIVVSVGPQHPSLAAPVRIQIQADGELMERVSVEQGYMHRGIELLATQRPWGALGGLLSRCEWLAGMNGDYLAAAAIEQLCGITPAPRANWLRSLVLEISRLASHLFWFGDLGLEVGAITPIFWALEQREGALDLLELLSGARYHHGWIVPGGMRSEPPAEFYARLSEWTRGLHKRIDSFEDFFSDNALWVNRSELVGVLEADYALSHGASGPVLRASGVAHDLRRDGPYAAYGELTFDVPVGEFGDSLDRYRQRFMEMRESLRMIAQCVEALRSSPESGVRSPESQSQSPQSGVRSPESQNQSPQSGVRSPESGNTNTIAGPVQWEATGKVDSDVETSVRVSQSPTEISAQALAPDSGLRTPDPGLSLSDSGLRTPDPGLTVPPGEAYVSVEGPRGELALYVQSDGGPRPVRVHLRGPSLPHLHLLDELCAGHLLADLFVIYASLDIMVGEADR